MKTSAHHTLIENALTDSIHDLALTMRPATIKNYRWAADRFLAYLRAAYPNIHRLCQLRRDPHILGWLRSLCEENPPLANQTRRNGLLCMRRLLDDLAERSSGGPPMGLLVSKDLPPLDQYLPKPLSPEDDQLVEQQLRAKDDLISNALLLLRRTGIRIGECIQLPVDCLRSIEDGQWALHVPLGKLHTERWVPADDDTRNLIGRIVSLRRATDDPRFLVPRIATPSACYNRMREALAKAARRAGCSTASATPHRLRHTYASELPRAGVSLPALKELLGHKSLNMTMRYLQVTQIDLQREYGRARQNINHLHTVPALVPPAELSPGLPAITRAVASARHLVEMYRRHFASASTEPKLRRLANRLDKILAEIQKLGDTPPE